MDSTFPDAPTGAGFGKPELYTADEVDAIEKHIGEHFGPFANVFHEIVSPDIHVDIAVIEPREEMPYYTLVTMGMGAHRMNVPAELAEFELERAELAISLPASWKVEDVENPNYFWPLRLLKELARMPGEYNTWLTALHTVQSSDGEFYAPNTKLGATILVPAQGDDESGQARLPNGETVNFYHIFPIYLDELEYGLTRGKEELLEKLAAGTSILVDPTRPSVVGKPKKGLFGKLMGR